MSRQAENDMGFCEAISTLLWCIVKNTSKREGKSSLNPTLINNFGTWASIDPFMIHDELDMGWGA